MSTPRTRRREKLGPDAAVRRAILAAASTVVREQGIGKLSIGAVLERAALGTRAFYRHFESKDELVAALFLDMARAEERRLRRRMAPAATEIDAVAAWIDGRLDLAFDDNIRADLRRLSMEAQSQSSALVQPAYAEMLKPLSETLQRGLASGTFHHIEPMTDAQFIHGVVWAGINQHWATGDFDRTVLRDRMLQFCLRGLGARVAEPIEGE
ncbi:TetR family transcriptional regulator [Mycobacterium sp. 852002-51971_SCH5477799-a]|uniref:TetR/AcrR family transcriptional regulator n=1 Tax=Mycobacterium sp. 852002-51971_SCH5477799-a TaxID=1834106 RepID=UPI0007FBA36D|nr:TetR/AcrR family transcriptional regulator [Mycobacterium sp. 852002-51971_SCH5477799-a]OBF61853.1 TetR family transcriptional regulator [Mycobacterium sp. 852002-51971_SCH5477799-a]